MISISIIIWNSILIYYTFYKKFVNSWDQSFSSFYRYFKQNIFHIIY